MKKYIIKVEIKNIEVTTEDYSFDFIIKVNGLDVISDNYDDTYCNGKTVKEWKEELEKGEALSLVLGRYYDEIANKEKNE